MRSDKCVIADGYTLMRLRSLIPLTWFGIYIVYPSWLLPVSLPARVAIYLLFISYFSLNAYLLHRWIRHDSADDRLRIPGLRGIWLRTKGNLLILGVLLIAAIFRIFYVILPIANNNDEGAHSLYSLFILRDLSRYTERILAMDAYSFVRILIFLSILGFAFKVWYLNRRSENVRRDTKALTVLGGAIVIILAGHFYLLRNQEYQIGLIRFPPLGKISSLISYSLFGVSEFAARLPSFIFSLLSGAVIYQLIRLYRGKMAAALGATCLLFLPGYFFYSNLAYLEAGAIFFIILSSYYFMRHFRTLDPRDFLLSMFFVGLGFMQRRMLAPVFGVMWIYLGLAKLRGRSVLHWRTYLKYSWVGLVPVIPWLVIGKFFVWRNYVFTPSNWLSYRIVTSYLRNIPSQTTYPIFIIFAVGFLWALLKGRDDLTIYSLVLFAVYYIFFTSDYIVGHPRFMTVFYPSIVIISVMAIYSLTERLGRRKIAYVLSILISAYLLLGLPINLANSRAGNNADYQFSFDGIFTYLEENPPNQNGKLVYIEPLDSAIEFYLIKYGISYARLDAGAIPVLDRFQEYCRRNHFQYLLFAYPNYTYANGRIHIYELAESLYRENGGTYKTLVTLKRKQSKQTIILGKLDV